MAEVKKLTDELSNKIAAGEVVERPASIVKELVENAIDAESTRVDIEIEEGGLSKIRVVDNGSGMTRDNAELAFLRHATSKITSERDLFQIASLGFRGEALPSIAAVSNLDLTTGTGEGEGTLIRYQGGKRIALSAAKARKGTDITVRDLFFNTPARLKYMKTIHTEIGNITDVVNRLALAHPAVAITLSHNGRQLLFTNGSGDMKAVLAAIYGRRTAAKFLPVKTSSMDYKIQGLAAEPEVNRASRQYISIFINGRYVRHFPIVKAVEKAYHTLLPIGRHPMIALHIEMDPVLIDVNVHPAKLEVKISKEQELLTLIEQALKETLSKQTFIPEVETSRAKNPKTEQVPLEWEARPKQPEHTSQDTTPSPVYRQNTPEAAPFPPEEALEPREPAYSLNRNPAPAVEEYQPTENVSRPVPEPEPKAAAAGGEKEKRVPELEPIGQLQGTYILAQNENGLYIIDQHAAQERIYYEYYRDKITETNRHIQELMIPMTLELSPDEERIITAYEEDLKQAGVYLEPFGFRTYRVSSHPAWFPAGEEENTIRELIQQLLEDKQIRVSALLEEAAILMSCKGAIKANRHLRSDEIQSLLEDLRHCETPFTCPHGRPVFIHFSGYDMEKMFKRVM
ncbi:DNA mismatch repair endonuclease MutL [Salibacterium halotolerans]|uniref:DNA mismatch repair protein MutL n=1 Tax=Salibacterium halotolerans TaxID=1884432 RepID=A0A1I5UYQ1_9BACI|nr:DNA mismatch repair endonuclease MutL [Salibacterium halotolerans]SFQ00338.1 DNA mismatch repair protein MutL [Salibacterium halotolerans]